MLLLPTLLLLPTFFLVLTLDVLLFFTLLVLDLFAAALLDLDRFVAVLFLETFGFVAFLFGVVVDLFCVVLGFEKFLLLVALLPPLIDLLLVADLLGAERDALGLDIERPPPREAPWPMRCANKSEGNANAKKTNMIPNLCFMLSVYVVMIN
jgi:hypothetical protein